MPDTELQTSGTNSDAARRSMSRIDRLREQFLHFRLTAASPGDGMVAWSMHQEPDTQKKAIETLKYK